MRGISTIIEVILVLIITISLIFFVYQWSFSSTLETQQNIEKNLAQNQGCLKIENIDLTNKKITIRNCGENGLSKFVVYIDSSPIAYYTGILGAGDITQISYTGNINYGDHEIFVSSDYAETSKITFNIREVCDFYIHQADMTNTYSISQSNKMYCLAENIYIGSKDAINFSSGVQNSTLECQGYNIDGNSALNTNGVYLTGSSTKYNTIKNCNITDFYTGIYLQNGPSNNVLNNIVSSNSYGFNLQSSSNNTIINNTAKNNINGIDLSLSSNNNVITNSIAFNNSYNGIYIISSSNNTITNSIVANNSFYGIQLLDSSNNTITNSIVVNNSFTGPYAGIYLYSSSNNNILTDNIVKNNFNDGILISSSSNNTISGGSVSNNYFDYRLTSAGKTNNFTKTNFTSTNYRSIFFMDSTSWFNYNNETTGNIWLKTNISSSSQSISRKLINWSNVLMQWNDTASATLTATYNITGLLISAYYNVYNNSVLAYTIYSGSKGQINFTINLPSNEEHNITVQKATSINITNCFDLNAPDTFYILKSNASSPGTCFNVMANNVTLDCQGYQANYSYSIKGYGVNNTGGYDYVTIKNCNFVQGKQSVTWSSAIYANGMINSTVQNNTMTVSSDLADGIDLYYVNNSIVINNTITTSGDNTWGMWMNFGGENNTISNNMIATLGTEAWGIWIETASKNIISNNSIKVLGAGGSREALLLQYSDSNILTNNMLTVAGSGGGIDVIGSNNNITGGSITGSDFDYSVSEGSSNYFTNTNFTAARKISIAGVWFNYNNETTGNIWLKTNVSLQSIITRKLINWNQNLMQWNDTSTTATTAIYNVSGLPTYSKYYVYDNFTQILGSPFNSSSSGEINFTINLPIGKEHSIRVQKEVCDYTFSTIPYQISNSNRYYCLSANVVFYSTENYAIRFGPGVQNTTLDCLNHYVSTSSTWAATYGIEISGPDKKSNTVKNCLVEGNDWANFTYDIFIGDNYYNTIINNTLINTTDSGIYMSNSSYNTLINNTINTNKYGFKFGNYSSNNIITGGSSNNNIYDYYLATVGTTNNFTNINFTAPRTIYFNDTTSWFNYQNDSSQNIWLKTNVSAQTNMTRKLINWNQTLIKWNDTANTAITARYNVTGLSASIDYFVYNNSIFTYSINSGSNDQIIFIISLPALQEHEIRVEKSP
jgi:parallel beta-helix repeat protein